MSPSFSDTRLRRYLAGALTPPRREEVELALATDPLLQARLVQLREEGPVEPVSPWRMPPPGLFTGRSMDVAAQPLWVMGDDAQPESVSVQLVVPEGAERWMLVLMERTGEGWQVIMPTAADEALAAGELPREPDGRIRLDVAVDGPGPWRFAVVLVPPEVAVQWDAEEPWAEVQRALAEGRLVAQVVEVG